MHLTARKGKPRIVQALDGKIMYDYNTQSYKTDTNYRFDY